MKEKVLDEFSVLNFVKFTLRIFNFFKIELKKIIAISSFTFLIFTLYNYVKQPLYYSTTSFVLENESSSNSLNEIASIASIAGINASAFMDIGNLFQIDNIQELYKSNSMIKKALLSRMSENNQLFINYFSKKEKIDKKWTKFGVNFQAFISDNYAERIHDSIIKQSIKIINEKYLSVLKPNRKTSVIQINFNHSDEILAKLFNEKLVEIVNQFYFKTKTKKTGDNLKILQKQADSVKKVLDNSILYLAKIDQKIPNPNPLSKVSLVPYQKALINVQANSGIYQEVIKQLEITKINHRNKTPLIQIIDKPVLPLKNSKLTLIECIAYGYFLGFLISVFTILFSKFIKTDLIKIH